jgi:hypothetical protein
LLEQASRVTQQVRATQEHVQETRKRPLEEIQTVTTTPMVSTASSAKQQQPTSNSSTLGNLLRQSKKAKLEKQLLKTSSSMVSNGPSSASAAILTQKLKANLTANKKKQEDELVLEPIAVKENIINDSAIPRGKLYVKLLYIVAYRLQTNASC